MANNNDEPASAPQQDRWYDMRLGSSFKDNSTTKFCTLRYEFKPASIDKSQPGSLYKNKENRVTVEFHNNQPGKSNVSFEGSSEDYKDNDAVLFFDGETFRLERLHRAVKRLRHVRLPGEHAAASNMTPAPPAGTTTDSRSPPLGKISKAQALNKTVMHPVPVEVERIDIGEPESSAPRPMNKGSGLPSVPVNPFPSPDPKSSEENLDILGDDDGGTPSKAIVGQAEDAGFDINISNQNDTDDEIADVDVSDEADEGLNAAEALRAQANAVEEQHQETSSSSGSGSGSSSSGSGSGSSSSDSDGSDDDSASSGGDVDT
ncbi:uncharacterized protein LOC103995763 [Musa acuminata AAA Group]|uniref:uncharacterized protein LOC103995763 n=1 Tax=Musa acuminata AAA Group TaxID=214697 RepID=UPI0031E19730